MICTNFLGRHVSASDKLGAFIVIYYGLGVRKAKIFCKFAGMPYTANLQSTPLHKVSYLETLIAGSCLKEFELRRQVSSHLYFKYSSGTFQGLRLSQGLPSNGQRSKTNAQTSKKHKIDFSKFSK
jgi:small subunit ribosomal protein S13